MTVAMSFLWIKEIKLPKVLQGLYLFLMARKDWMIWTASFLKKICPFPVSPRASLDFLKHLMPSFMFENDVIWVTHELETKRLPSTYEKHWDFQPLASKFVQCIFDEVECSRRSLLKVSSSSYVITFYKIKYRF